MAAQPEPNRLRYAPQKRGGHVESYFWRANHPSSPQAFWLKTTILAPLVGPAVAEVWCSIFDSPGGRYWGAKATLPWSEEAFTGSPLRVAIAGCGVQLDSRAGASSGALENEHGKAHWDLRWRAIDEPLGAPLSIFPYAWMVERAFPKNKLLTPFPALSFEGSVVLDDVPLRVEGWGGMQGHNWGRFHAPEYAWGQCLFGGAGAPECMVEGFSARTRLAGCLTPRLSALVVRRGAETYAFNRLRDLKRHYVELDYPRWLLRARGPAGEADLEMRGRPEEMVCLGYRNPNDQLSYCLNSKLAQVRLEVRPAQGAPFSYESEHGGALEFLAPTNPGFAHVV